MKYEEELLLSNEKLEGLKKDEIYYFVKSCLSSGKRVLLTLSTFSRQGKDKKRSVKQNAYYWKFFVSYPASELNLLSSCGENINIDDLHEHFRDKFLKKEVVLNTGEIISTTRSTTDLSTSEFTNYLDSIQSYVLDRFGIDVFAYININSGLLPKDYFNSLQ